MTTKRVRIERPMAEPIINPRMLEIFEEMLALGPVDEAKWYRLLTLFDREITLRPKPWIIPLCPPWREPWQEYQAELAERCMQALAARNGKGGS